MVSVPDPDPPGSKIIWYHIKQCCGSERTLFGSGSWFSCSFGSGSGSGSEQDPNKFGSGSDQNISNFLKIEDLTDVEMIFLVLRFHFQVILKPIYIYLEIKFKFLRMKNQVFLNKICIRILSAPDPDPN